ncbi:hypothetical protein VT06_16315 [Arsukibacterium sp. MJ3]|uniref:hypothetical protein n=1 Tax=Arsukibacterium sp. MJ3 TaxID=1632859 RepID=UPI000627304B|nr:hypothetical protein [Arsukibacterium sp. MJ3]KKO47575.1 hypothetical protein VT06_16315 [Arsukibacterium sp. MJ3]
MSEEITEIGFNAVDDWSVEDFYTFFHQLNILYNRLAVLEDIKFKQNPIKLKTALYGSLSRIPLENRLTVKSIEIHSPGDFNLLGLDKILIQMRGLIKDFTYKNRLEREAKEEQLSHEKEMNELKVIAEKQNILAKQVQLMKDIGYDQEQIDAGIKALYDPLKQLEDIAQRKKVTLKSTNKQSQSDT